jgi:hypothetical protein
MITLLCISSINMMMFDYNKQAYEKLNKVYIDIVLILIFGILYLLYLSTGTCVSMFHGRGLHGHHGLFDLLKETLLLTFNLHLTKLDRQR